MADPLIAEAIEEALGSARTVVNVGLAPDHMNQQAGKSRRWEPSIEMIRKRSPSIAPVVRASADDLPLDDNAFDAAMAILTIHHWPDKEAGLREVRRVTRGRVALLTFDPPQRLADRLFPEVVAPDEAQMPAMADYSRWLGSPDCRLKRASVRC